MTPEERTLLTGLFDRVRQATTGPRDTEAEALIADEVRRQPAAPYLLAQTVIVQDQALRAANERLQQLEQQVREQATRTEGGGSFLGGIGKSLFGGSAPVQPAPASGASLEAAQAPGPWGRTANPAPQGGGYQNQAPPAQSWGAQPAQAPAAGGGSFLKGALGAAAGVAGGVLLADSIRGLFSGHGGGAGGLGIGQGFASPTGMGGGETIINNYYDTPKSTEASYDDNGSGSGYAPDYASGVDNGSSDPGFDYASGSDDYGSSSNDSGTYDT